MKSIRTLATVSLFIASAYACNAQETTFMRDGLNFKERTQQKYTVDGAGTLTVDADFGSIRIESWLNDEVDVEVEKRRTGVSEDSAREAFDDVAVDLSQRENDVEIRIDRKSRFGSDRVSVDIQVRVPESYSLDLKTSGGDIDIGDLKGDVLARTSGGDINVGNVTEALLRVHTSGGDVTVNGGGRDTKVSTSGGDIEIRDARGAVDANTSGGDITIGGTTGEVTAKTSGGDIEIERASGNTEAITSGGDIRIGRTTGPVTAKTSGGDITIERTNGEVDVHTSGGDVTIDSAEGSLKAGTSGGDIKISNATGKGVTARTSGGDIEARLTATVSALEEDWSLQSSGGELTIRIPENLPATLEAEIHLERSWFGGDQEYQIDSDFDLDEREDNGRNRRTIRATGDINGGGNLIRLETRGGDIQIRKVPS
jgi:DUF4097 and DUF4098 domain-containing protein YvlB